MARARKQQIILLTPETRQKLRRMAFERNCEWSEIVEEAIIAYWNRKHDNRQKRFWSVHGGPLPRIPVTVRVTRQRADSALADPRVVQNLFDCAPDI